jgi:hypothetical protein
MDGTGNDDSPAGLLRELRNNLASRSTSAELSYEAAQSEVRAFIDARQDARQDAAGKRLMADALLAAVYLQQWFDRLSSIGEAFDAPGADRQRLYGEALIASIHIIDVFPSAFKRGLARPLKSLLANLHDFEQGALSAFVRKTPGGRPTHLSEHTFRGMTLGVMRQIMLCGKSKSEAARLIANRLRKRGVRGPHGQPITEKKLVGQLSSLNKQPRDVRDQYDAINRARAAEAYAGSDAEAISQLLDTLDVYRNYGS